MIGLESSLYLYTIGRKAQEFQNKMASLFKEPQEMIEPEVLKDAPLKYRKEPNFYHSYVEAYEQIRFQIVMK